MVTVVVHTSVNPRAASGSFRAPLAGAHRDATQANATRCLHEWHSSGTGSVSIPECEGHEATNILSAVRNTEK